MSTNQTSMNINETSRHTDQMRAALGGLSSKALIAGGLGSLACIAGVVLEPRQFFSSYLFAYMFWFGVTTGSLSILMLHNVVGGGWGFIIRRPLEAATRLLPLVALFFVPLLFGLKYLYPWAQDHPQVSSEISEAMRIQSRYMNFPGFLGRAIVLFLVWMGFAFILNRWSAQQDVNNDGDIYDKMTNLSAVGMVVYVVTVSFAVIDWVMPLTPGWYSSIIGLLFVAAQALSTFALMLFLVDRLVGDHLPLEDEVRNRYMRDLGNLTLACVLLWAYTSFSQYLITYSGNTSTEVTWYLPRLHNGWQWISWAIVFLHFFLPFFVLLIGSDIKRHPRRLAKIAAFIIFMRLVDLWWWISPSLHPTFSLSWLDLAAPVALGGIWLWAWAGQLQGRPLLPAHDPRLRVHWPAGEVHHG